MKLNEIGSVSVDEIRAQDFDLAILASGYESRAVHVAETLSDIRVRRKVALGFTDRINERRKKNDQCLETAGFRIVEAHGDDPEALAQVIAETQEEVGEPKILIDITSMTRAWYGGAIRYIREYARECEDLQVTFTYSPSAYTDPQPPRPNKHVGPLPGFTSLRLPTFPTALILGLGYEPERALGVVDFLEPAVTYAFIADPALDERFTAAAFGNNAALLKRLPAHRIIRYPMKDMAGTFELLRAVAQSVGSEYRTIVAPLGPKPLALAAFLAATSGIDLDVWRISPGEGGFAYDRPPLGSILGLYARFLRDARHGSLPRERVATAAHL